MGLMMRVVRVLYVIIMGEKSKNEIREGLYVIITGEKNKNEIQKFCGDQRDEMYQLVLAGKFTCCWDSSNEHGMF